MKLQSKPFRTAGICAAMLVALSAHGETVSPAPQQPNAQQSIVAQTTRYALLIGNQNYNDKNLTLQNPLEDVRRLREVLIDAGFTVSVVPDGKMLDIQIAIAEFMENLTSGGEQAVGFFYYAGHGVSVVDPAKTTNYLLPVDLPAATIPNIKAVGISVTKLLEDLSTINAKAIFLVSDACRTAAIDVAAATQSGPTIAIGPPVRGTGETLQRAMYAPRSRGNTFVAYATGEGQTAGDDGVFSKVLADHIKQSGIRAAEALNNALGMVGTMRKQSPVIVPGLANDFCFHACSLPPVIGSGELEAWRAADGKPKNLDVFLQYNPTGTYAESAKRQLDVRPVPVDPKDSTAANLLAKAKATDLCGAYNSIGKSGWTQEFHKPTEFGTWHVFVETLPPTGSLTVAMDARDKWRRKFPNLEFALMETVNRDGSSNRRYAIVLAEGLRDKTNATEITEFAKTCGIAKSAYRYQQDV